MLALTYTRIFCPTCGARLQVSGKRWPFDVCCATWSTLVGIGLLTGFCYLGWRRMIPWSLAFVAIIPVHFAFWLFYQFCESFYIGRKRTLEQVPKTDASTD